MTAVTHLTTQSNQAFSAQGGSSTFQTLSFNNANGLTFSNVAGAIQASYTVPSTAGLISALNISAGTTSGNLSAVTFSNSNGVTFGLNAGTITASVKTDYLTTARASNDGVGLNTAQSNVTWTVNSSGISLDARGYAGTGTTFNGANISGSITQNSNGINLSLSANPSGGADGYNILAAGTQTANTTGTVLFSNSNGITFGMSNSSVITASHNGITQQSTQPVALSGSNGSFNFSTATFGNLNGLSFYTSNGSMVGSYTVPSTAGLISAINISAGATSNNLSAVTFSNSNNVSFGLNGSTVTATASFNQTNQSAIRGFGVSNTGQTAGNTGISTGVDWVLAGSQSITLSQSTAVGGPNTVWIQHPAWLTTARASTDAIGLNTALTAGPLSWTVNSSGLSLNAGGVAGTSSGFAGNLISGSITHNTAGINISLNHPAWLTTAMQSNAATISNINISAGTTSTNASAFTFNNANGITFGLGTGASAGSITASHNGLTTARASNDGIGLNTAQSNVTWTVNSSGLSFDARGYAGTATAITGNASITLNSGGLSFNGSNLAGVGTTFNGANISGSMTVNSVGVNLSMSVAPPGAAAENNWHNLLGANTAGNTTASGSTIGLSGINLTLSGTNNSVINISAPATSSIVGVGAVNISTAGSTISISAPNVTVNSYIPYFPASTSSQTNGAMGTSTASAFVFPVVLDDQVNFNHVKYLQSLSYVTSTISGQQTITSQFGLYSNNAGTLSQISSGSFSLAMTVSSVSATLSYPVSTSPSSYTYTTLAVTATAQGQSLFGTAGNRIFDLQFGNSVSLTPGIYWVGIHQRQSTTSANVGLSSAFVGNAMNGSSGVGPIGASTAQFSSRSEYHLGAHGFYTSTGSAGYGGTALPASMFLSGFNNNLNVMPMVTFMST